VNPLAAGHLKPYRSTTRPEVVALNAVGPDGGLLDPAQIAGPFELAMISARVGWFRGIIPPRS
jgi:hypothetical protein